MKRRMLFVAVFIIGAAACGVGGAALGAFLTGCGGEAANKPLVAPNPDGVDCVAQRGKVQLQCVQDFKTAPEIDKCIADKLKTGEAPNCINEAGIAAYITSRDAGVDAK